MASQEGAGGTGKRRRETGKRKTTASKWKLWEEEESKKSVGSMLSREERKAMAVSFPLSLFLALSSPAPPFLSLSSTLPFPCIPPFPLPRLTLFPPLSSKQAINPRICTCILYFFSPFICFAVRLIFCACSLMTASECFSAKFRMCVDACRNTSMHPCTGLAAIPGA